MRTNLSNNINQLDDLLALAEVRQDQKLKRCIIMMCLGLCRVSNMHYAPIYGTNGLRLMVSSGFLICRICRFLM